MYFMLVMIAPQSGGGQCVSMLILGQSASLSASESENRQQRSTTHEDGCE